MKIIAWEKHNSYTVLTDKGDIYLLCVLRTNEEDTGLTWIGTAFSTEDINYLDKHNGNRVQIASLPTDIQATIAKLGQNNANLI